MEKMIHPISGEKGYFATSDEKEIIDLAIILLIASQESMSSHSVFVRCGVADD